MVIWNVRYELQWNIIIQRINLRITTSNENQEWRSSLRGGQGFRSLDKTPTPDRKPCKKVAREYHPRHDVPGKYTKKNGSVEVLDLVTRKISWQIGGRCQWHGPHQAYCLAHGQSTRGQEVGGVDGSDGGRTLTGQLRDSSGPRFLRMWAIVGLKDPAMRMSEGRTPLYRLLVPRVHQRPFTAPGGTQHGDGRGRGGDQ